MFIVMELAAAVAVAVAVAVSMDLIGFGTTILKNSRDSERLS